MCVNGIEEYYIKFSQISPISKNYRWHGGGYVKLFGRIS